MSRNKASDKKQKQQEGKVSFFGEMSMLSVTATIGLVALVILCVAFTHLCLPPLRKKIRVDDDAGIFTRSQIGDLEDMARQLSRRKDINVVIVTTRDKGRGYSNSDEDCERFAADYYKKACIKTSLVNNSGICILIDLTIDEPGQRFFWLYTYGTAYLRSVMMNACHCYDLVASCLLGSVEATVRDADVILDRLALNEFMYTE